MISFREVVKEDAQMILGWRTTPRVQNQMATEVPEGLEAQRQWIRDCRTTESYYHWIIQLHGTDSGLLSISGYTPASRSIYWGFYIGEADALGFGALVPPYFYNWVFTFLAVDRVLAEVHENNDVALSIHSRHGYRRSPELDRQVSKAGSVWALQALTLSKTSWQEQVRFHRFQSSFPTRLWAARPQLLRND